MRRDGELDLPWDLRGLPYQVELPEQDVHRLQLWVHEVIDAMRFEPGDRPRFYVALGGKKLVFHFSDATLATAFRVMWA